MEAVGNNMTPYRSPLQEVSSLEFQLPYYIDGFRREWEAVDVSQITPGDIELDTSTAPLYKQPGSG